MSREQPWQLELSDDEFESIDAGKRSFIVRPADAVNEVWEGGTLELVTNGETGLVGRLFAWVQSKLLPGDDGIGRYEVVADGMALINIEVMPVGYGSSRIADDQHNPRELALARAWAAELQRSRHGSCLLDAVLHGYKGQTTQSVRGYATESDYRAASRLMQWLGSNSGMGFLRAAMRDAGYRLERIEDAAEVHRDAA